MRFQLFNLFIEESFFYVFSEHHFSSPTVTAAFALYAIIPHISKNHSNINFLASLFSFIVELVDVLTYEVLLGRGKGDANKSNRSPTSSTSSSSSKIGQINSGNDSSGSGSGTGSDSSCGSYVQCSSTSNIGGNDVCTLLPDPSHSYYHSSPP